MSYTGTVENGVVKLPPEVRWPDGTTVRIEKIESQPGRNRLTQRLRELASKLEGLPPTGPSSTITFMARRSDPPREAGLR